MPRFSLETVSAVISTAEISVFLPLVPRLTFIYCFREVWFSLWSPREPVSAHAHQSKWSLFWGCNLDFNEGKVLVVDVTGSETLSNITSMADDQNVLVKGAKGFASGTVLRRLIHL